MKTPNPLAIIRWQINQTYCQKMIANEFPHKKIQALYLQAIKQPI